MPQTWLARSIDLLEQAFVLWMPVVVGCFIPIFTNLVLSLVGCILTIADHTLFLRLKIVKLSHIASCIVDVGRHRFFSWLQNAGRFATTTAHTGIVSSGLNLWIYAEVCKSWFTGFWPCPSEFLNLNWISAKFGKWEACWFQMHCNISCDLQYADPDAEHSLDQLMLFGLCMVMLASCFVRKHWIEKYTGKRPQTLRGGRKPMYQIQPTVATEQ